jgi:hypothetical protein
MTPRRAAMAATGRIAREACKDSAGFLNRCEIPMVTASIPPASALSASQLPRALNPSLWPLSQRSTLIAPPTLPILQRIASKTRARPFTIAGAESRIKTMLTIGRLHRPLVVHLRLPDRAGRAR